MYKHIVVTTSGSAVDKAAIVHAAGLTRTLGARLTLLTIVPDAEHELDLEGLSISAEEIEREWAAASLQALNLGELQAECTRLEPLHRPAQHRSIAQAIAEEAAALGADLLVMGTHGRQGFEQLVRGCVPDEVWHRATMPVLLIR